MWEEAGKMRLKNIELHSGKSIFKIDNITFDSSTTIQDSVINRSSISGDEKGEEELIPDD